MNKKNTLLAATLLLILLAPPLAAQAAGTELDLTKAQATLGGYAVGDDVDIATKLEWDGLSSDIATLYEVWNKTSKLVDLGSYTVPGATTAKGNREYTYTDVSGLTDKLGTHEYYVRIVDSTSSIKYDEVKFTVLVVDEEYDIGVTWEDTNNDRRVEREETVTFSIVTTWTYVNETQGCKLFVKDGDGAETLIDTVSVTTGSGSVTDTWIGGWNTEGEKTIVFILKDNSGTEIERQTVKITVGAASAAATAPAATTQSTGSATLVSLIQANWQILAIIMAVIVVGGVYLKKNE